MHRTKEVIDRLRNEGYSVSPGYLQYLLRERILRPPSERFGGAYVWQEPGIERLRSVLKRRGRGGRDSSEARGRCSAPEGESAAGQVKP